MDEYQLGHLYRLSFHVGYVRYRQRISFCTLGSLCQLCCFCNDLVQPVIEKINAFSVNWKFMNDLKCAYIWCTHLNFIVFADWHTANVVFLSQFFGQRCWHQLTTNVWRGSEVPLTVFAAVWGNVLVELHDELNLAANNFSKIKNPIRLFQTIFCFKLFLFSNYFCFQTSNQWIILEKNMLNTLKKMLSIDSAHTHNACALWG